MKTPFDRIVMTVIALALSVIALNPWFAPGRVGADEGITKVDIVRIEGKDLDMIRTGGVVGPLPVQVFK